MRRPWNGVQGAMQGPGLAFGLDTVGYRSGQTGQTVNLLAQAFEGSNPSPTIRRGVPRRFRGGLRVPGPMRE